LSITIPPFNQYQSPIVPLRGLWNAPPVEGDKFITAEIDWLVTTTQQAVQFAVSANSPVAFSQIVALAVDNSRSGADVDFVFSDSGFVLTVPALNQGVFPVFTNGLMFYAIAQNAVIGDVTTFQVLNSMPPPTYINPSIEQNHASTAGIPVINSTTPIVPAGVTGTLNTLSLSITLTSGATAENMELNLVDGNGRTLWINVYTLPATTTQNFPVELTGLQMRFVNGLSMVVSSSTFGAGTGLIVANVYYSQP
jgi:hypothetical protein